jgi:hypothetical protein
MYGLSIMKINVFQSADRKTASEKGKMKIKIVLLTALFMACSSFGLAQSGTTEVKIYLVALGDNGKNGKKVGCDDSLVPLTRKVTATAAPLRAAILELFADRAPDKKEIDLNLGNYWRGMQLKSVSIEKGTAIIHLTGEAPSVAGICDEPRIKGQIIETAKQFPTVKKVKVFINGKPMDELISPV